MIVEEDTMFENSRTYTVDEKGATAIILLTILLEFYLNIPFESICTISYEGNDEDSYRVDAVYRLPHGGIREVAGVFVTPENPRCAVVIKEFANAKLMELLNYRKIDYYEHKE